MVNSLFSDIIYKGICGSYDYNLTIKSNKYFGAFCDGNRLLVYEDKSRDYIRAIYTDPTDNSFDIYSIYTGRVYKSFNYKKDDIKKENATKSAKAPKVSQGDSDGELDSGTITPEQMHSALVKRQKEKE